MYNRDLISKFGIGRYETHIMSETLESERVLFVWWRWRSSGKSNLG